MALSQQQKMELVKALLECPMISEQQTRDVVVDGLPNEIKSRIRRNESNLVDVMNIVTTALNYSDGLENFIESVRMYEGSSLSMQEVDRILATMKKTNGSRPRLRTKILLPAGIVVLLVAGLIFYMIYRKPPTVHLRREGGKVSGESARKDFELNENTWIPLKFIPSDFKEQDKVIVDRVTGLMWQKSGSDKLKYKEADVYIDRLNRESFAGYRDWRLPTIEELMSLLEPEKQSNNLYINPIFDAKQKMCWSKDEDMETPGSAWIVYFCDQTVFREIEDEKTGLKKCKPYLPPGYVRAVRNLQWFENLGI